MFEYIIKQLQDKPLLKYLVWVIVMILLTSCSLFHNTYGS